MLIVTIALVVGMFGALNQANKLRNKSLKLRKADRCNQTGVCYW